MSKRRKSNSAQGNARKHVRYSQDLPQFLDAESTITASRFATRRLPEMQTLWNKFLQNSTVNHDDEAYFQSRGCKQSKRHLRRRTGSHHRRKRHRYPAGRESNEKEAGEKLQCEEIKSRKAGRKPQLLREKHSQWRNVDCTSMHRESKNWLMTHLWHSKRFYMTPPLPIYNNWCIPLGHTNRGSRAALRLAKSKSTLQDATWTICGQSIVLETMEREHLLLMLEKMCGGKRNYSAPFLTNDCVISGLETGYGFIYEMDCTFPAGVVGPASFIFGKSPNQTHFVRISVEGSIFSKVELLVKEGLQNVKEKDNIEFTLLKDANCLLRLRGSEASNALVNALSLSSTGDDTIVEWSKGHLPQDFHRLIPYGTIVRVQYKGVNINSHREEHQSDKNIDDDCTNDELVKRLEKRRPELNHPMLQPDELVLVSQVPNAMHEGQNNAVCGFDIICSPSVASEIFTALCTVGGSCAIGFIEDACNRIEAEPPLPVWPRDFPDTSEGRDYAAGTDSGWGGMRYCIEEGLRGGRIKTGLNRLLQKCSNHSKTRNEEDRDPSCISRKLTPVDLDWNRLCLPNKSTVKDINSQVVMVRGNFTSPFVQALEGFGKEYLEMMEEADDCRIEGKPSRRRRRKVRSSDETVIVPPMRAANLQQHQSYCSNLLNSLTIPALLRCHIKVEGRGTLQAGMIITANVSDSEMSKEATELGFVTSGGFSQSRGEVIGVGIVSSQRFLSFLSGAKNEDFVLLTRHSVRSIAMKVTLQCKDDGKYMTKSDVTASLRILS